MANEHDTAFGLMDWVNSLGLGEPVKRVGELNDGVIIWRLLQKIDRISFPGHLPEETDAGDEWTHKWQNLKHLYDALTIFLVEECGQKPLLSGAGGRAQPDLKALARDSSLPDLVLLLKLCVVAAINCAERIDFLTKMQELGEQTQQVLMATAQEAGESEETDIEDEPGSVDGGVFDTSSVTGFPSGGVVDTDLASEERLGKVIADNQRTTLEKREVQKALDDLHLRYEKLQEKNDRSQEELNEANDRLGAVLAGKGDLMQGKTDAKSETVIAALEARVLQAEAENEGLRKSNEVLKIKADRVQKLQDDFDEIKIERDKLSRKANTAEKYKQKLESIQDIEKDNHSLKLKVQELQTQIRQSDSSQASTSNLQREIDEYRRLLPSIEQERYDLNEMKKRLEFDYHTLEARWHDLSEEYQRSQNQVEELRGRLQDYEDGITPSTPTKIDAANTRSLEAEEADFAEAEARLTEALLNSSSNGTNNDKEGEEQSGISEDELRAIMSAMRAQAQAGSATERESGVRAQKKLLIAIDRQRTKNISLAEHMKKQSELIHELQTKNATAEQQAKEAQETTEKVQVPDVQSVAAVPEPTAAEKAAAEVPVTLQESKLVELFQVNENLKREIRLMTSAWYEQNQRMAASGATGFGAVSLMRSKLGRSGGIDEPRSFLGRQRKVIDAVVLGTISKTTSLR